MGPVSFVEGALKFVVGPKFRRPRPNFCGRGLEFGKNGDMRFVTRPLSSTVGHVNFVEGPLSFVVGP